MTATWAPGAVLAVGVFLVILGARGVAVPLPRPLPRGGRLQLRRAGAVLPALGVALGVLVLTGWPVAAVLLFVLVAGAPEVVTAGRERKALIERSAAVGKWCTELHDLMERGAGTSAAIAATATSAPLPIRKHVARLARSQRRSPELALAEFADACGDESADLVANLLLLDARGHGGRLANSLGQLGADIASSVESRQRIEVGRVRTRTQARAAAVTAVLGVLIFVVANREFLRAYDSAVGQVVLAVWGAGFVACLWVLARMDRPPRVERFPLPVSTRWEKVS